MLEQLHRKVSINSPKIFTIILPIPSPESGIINASEFQKKYSCGMVLSTLIYISFYFINIKEKEREIIKYIFYKYC